MSFVPASRVASLFAVPALVALATAGVAAFRLVTAGESMTAAATAWLAGLDEVQRARAVADFQVAARTDWHFVPKPIRKGLPLTDMTKTQRDQAHALLKSALSEAGYGKARVIMDLDELLRRNIQDGRIRFTTYQTRCRHWPSSWSEGASALGEVGSWRGSLVGREGVVMGKARSDLRSRIYVG